MATLIKADGTQKEIQPQNGTDFCLEELQKYVDGYIQVIALRNQEDEILVINEDGERTLPHQQDCNRSGTETPCYLLLGLDRW